MLLFAGVTRYGFTEAAENPCPDLRSGILGDLFAVDLYVEDHEKFYPGGISPLNLSEPSVFQ